MEVNMMGFKLYVENHVVAVMLLKTQISWESRDDNVSLCRSLPKGDTAGIWWLARMFR